MLTNIFDFIRIFCSIYACIDSFSYVLNIIKKKD